MQSTNVTDGRTDGQRDRQTVTGRQQKLRLRIASRGKNRQRNELSNNRPTELYRASIGLRLQYYTRQTRYKCLT